MSPDSRQRQRAAVDRGRDEARFRTFGPPLSTRSTHILARRGMFAYVPGSFVTRDHQVLFRSRQSGYMLIAGVARSVLLGGVAALCEAGTTRADRASPAEGFPPLDRHLACARWATKRLRLVCARGVLSLSDLIPVGARIVETAVQLEYGRDARRRHDRQTARRPGS